MVIVWPPAAPKCFEVVIFENAFEVSFWIAQKLAVYLMG